MKTVLFTAAAAMIVVGIAVFGFHDRTVFVPAPESAAENFGRELGTGRYDRAAALMSPRLQRIVTPAQLRQAFEPVRQRGGHIDDVRGVRVSMGEHTSVGRAEVTTDRGVFGMDFDLTRQQGLWVVDSLPAWLMDPSLPPPAFAPR